MKNSCSIKNKADAASTEERGRQGLCTFCDVADRCALIEPSDMPVLECEEFRSVLQRQGRAVEEKDLLDKYSTEPPRSGRLDHTDWGRKGLCGNCAIYETCPFSKDEGGIWHCEEYR